MSDVIAQLRQLSEEAIAHDEALVARLRGENKRMHELLTEGYARMKAHYEVQHFDGDAVWINKVIDFMFTR